MNVPVHVIFPPRPNILSFAAVPVHVTFANVKFPDPGNPYDTLLTPPVKATDKPLKSLVAEVNPALFVSVTVDVFAVMVRFVTVVVSHTAEFALAVREIEALPKVRVLTLELFDEKVVKEHVLPFMSSVPLVSVTTALVVNAAVNCHEPLLVALNVTGPRVFPPLSIV